MVRARHIPFLQNFFQQLRVLSELIRNPDRTWISLRKNPPDGDVYLFLILPLAVVYGGVIFFGQLLYEKALPAAVYGLSETCIVTALIFLSAGFIAFLSSRFGGDAKSANVHTSLPYIFVPWLGVSIVVAMMDMTIPMVAGALAYILHAAGLAAGAYMLYFYTGYYLKMRKENFALFFALACAGIIVSGILLFWIEEQITDRLVSF